MRDYVWWVPGGRRREEGNETGGVEKGRFFRHTRVARVAREGRAPGRYQSGQGALLSPPTLPLFLNLHTGYWRWR